MEIMGMPSSWISAKVLSSNTVEIAPGVSKAIHSIEVVVTYPDGTKHIETIVRVEQG